ncbi:TELO2-interacting protein 1 homolog isoform X2 [Cephus cinctus]|nr:TELO2-interacting protein 1 homolog isoform X2 [Cephus cinctus]XP_024946103.1 TELO2-interacting protein 1 homolog isoform X2 [Cephus cinctus]
MVLCQVHDQVDDDIVLRAQVADVIMLFLPGIASGLQEITLGSDIQGHKVTMMALRAWSRIISLVMEDIPQEENIPSLDAVCHVNISNSSDPLKCSLHAKGVAGMKELMQTATRSQNWLDAAAIKLNVLIPSLRELTQHSHFKVRKELAESVRLLLNKCSRNMKPSFTELVEILISLSEDEVEEVNKIAKQALNDVNEKCTANQNSRPLIELLEENFYKLLTKLPRIIRGSDDAAQLSHLNHLAGYLRLFGKQRLPQVISSIAHLRRLLLALVYVAELNCSNVSLLEDVAIKHHDDAMQYATMHPWKEFKFIRESSVEDKLTYVCKYLGEFGNLSILVDAIQELILDMPQYKKELTLLLNWIINVPFEDPTTLSLYKTIVDNYISPDSWYLPLAVTQNVSLREAQSNIVQCGLFLEGLSIIAQRVGEEYHRFLLKTLYLVIERAGSGYSVLSMIGFQTLQQIAKTLRYATVTDLLQANIDYLSYHVTLKLRRVERNPGVLDVVALIMKYSTMDVLPCLKDFVEDVLRQSAANFQQKNSYSFLKVFHIFAVCIRRLTLNEQIKTSVEEEISEDPSEIVIRAIQEYYQAKRISERIEDDDLGGKPEDILEELKNKADLDNEVQEYLEDEKKAEPPLSINMIKEISKRCLHFLPSKDLARVLLAMDTLKESLHILSDWENELLPIVHELWHPLVDRFKDPNPLVINRAWQLLITLADVSKDFIRSRTLKQVLPSISNFLKNSSKESYNQKSGGVYEFSQAYKLQKELLSQLGRTANNLQLQERELWNLLDIAQPYLSVKQNKSLQECCITMYKDIADYDADIVWVKCLRICNTTSTIEAPDDRFQTINLQVASTNIQSEYQKNVETIITYIQDKTIGVSRQ